MANFLGKNKNLLFLLIILTIASFFRLWQLDSLPAGLFPDEAANGLDILSIFQGQHSPFFERGLGREALFFYLQALSVFLFGIGVWQMHLVSALIGIATVLTTYFLAKNLFNQRVAFFTAFFLATSTWHTTLSRTGFRAILVPLFATLFFYFAYLVLKENSEKKRKLFTVLAGLSLGLGFYTYISFRAMVPILLLILILIALWKRHLFKLFWREMVIGFVVMILILLPLIIYFINHPDSFIGRAGYVSIFNPDQNKGDLFGTFLEVSKKTFLMFFTEGDLNWRHNVSGFGMLNPWVATFFAFGFLYSLLIILKRFLKQSNCQDYLKYLVLIIWFLGMLGPELMSAEAIPHGLRAIGAMPVVFFFPALMIDYSWRKMNLKIFWSVFLGLILLTGLLYDFYLYFGISANSPDFYYAYRSDLTVVSNYLNERDLKEKTYLVLDKYSVQTPEFLTARYQQPYILVDPATSYQTQLKLGDQIVFTQSTIFDTKKFELYHPETKLIKKEFNQFNQEIMRIYEK
ncbi:MAG: glycosyltransferase family 39 protein [Candidatus Nealsonbacteria bacterium]|nr:glycosyltransferase family 39 protein [Candidatus Nealsonbacteria bacterium]